EMAQLVMERVCATTDQVTAIGKVIFGNCFAPLDQNVARVAAYRAGIPDSVPAFTINGTCGSSMQAIISAVQAVQCGEAQVVLAGGVESMSNAPYIMETARWGQRIRHAQAYDLLWKGMQEYPIGVGMGLTAENLAEQYDIPRSEQDEFAVLSHQRAAKAIDEGRFKAETIPIPVPRPRKEPLIFDTDEHVRRDITLEQLGRLPAAFKKDGTVTAGNACGMNDAGAAILVTTFEKALEMGLQPLVRVRGYRVVGVDPNIMGIGPVPAIREALARSGLGLGDIDRFEINEAFAAQYLACERELGLDRNKVNPYGSGISLGHPVGATGCRLVVTLFHSMVSEDLGLGVASLCAGGGMGFALVLERI
ncbi:MAG: acetyl-CoA C-acetyltransferase, partial [Thermodesulfobacteriota bacterium]|nr:acetyl-CoA C-acetyltransferase [Thermodesulfobacteriota bacterium]